MVTKVHPVPAQAATPRAAAWVGQAADAVRALFKAVNATTDVQRRQRDARSLRAYAQSLQYTDPRMASELRAVADRHTN